MGYAQEGAADEQFFPIAGSNWRTGRKMDSGGWSLAPSNLIRCLSASFAFRCAFFCQPPSLCPSRSRTHIAMNPIDAHPTAHLIFSKRSKPYLISHPPTKIENMTMREVEGEMDQDGNPISPDDKKKKGPGTSDQSRRNRGWGKKK